MNMSTALNNALGGLTAASRGAAVVSGNIANALTPGYARRSLELATSQIFRQRRPHRWRSTAPGPGSDGQQTVH